jgi:hypothetical protein
MCMSMYHASIVPNEKYVSERGCSAEVDNCVCSSSANFSTYVMDPVVPNEEYLFERSCCAEENDCV